MKRTGVCGKKNVMIILFGIQMTIIIHLHKSNNGDKKVEVYEDHINRHAVPNNSRETHGVFNGNPIDMVNDAWEQRYLVEPISDEMGGTIYNIPYKNAGYESGYINTGAQMDYITIVTLDESTDLITAFLSFGDYHK